MNDEYTLPTPDEIKKMSWWNRAYYWFWHDVCHCPEPFTYTLRRSAQEHPVPWIVIPAVIFTGIWLLFCWATGTFRKVKRHRWWLWWIIAPTVIGIAFWLLIVHLWGIL